MNKEYFKITETKSGFAIMLVKPLVHDAEITLTKHEGRFETTIKIFVYVSKYNF